MTTDRQRRVVITGSGVLTALGDSPVTLHAALCAGRSALRPLELAARNGMPGLDVGALDFEPRTYLPDGNLRPLDRTSRLATAAARLALESAGWSADRIAGTEVGLVLGTMFGSVHTISEFDRRAVDAGPNYAKPMDFANSVINAAAGQTAIWHGLRGVNATISGGTTSGSQALAYAADLIATGRADTLLAGGADELCFESLYGFYKAGLLYGREGGRPAPFDRRRDGLALGEAAALLVLEEADAAAARGATIFAEITGHGSAYDCSRGQDPAQAADALARSIGVALARAGRGQDDIEAVSASANGSVRGDRHEAAGLAAALGERAADLPLAAVKASLGETLGTSGALQAVVLVQAMQSGVLPGVHGLESTEDGFPLARLSAAPREVRPLCGLVTAVGLEGKSCALVIEAWDPARSAARP